MTQEKIKKQALESGMTEKAASRLASQAWGFNLKECAVGAKGNYRLRGNEIYVFCYFETALGRKWELEYVFRYSTGTLIRKTTPKYIK